MKIFISILLCFFVTCYGYQEDSVSNQIKKLLLTNPSYLENLNQSQIVEIVDIFSKHPHLAKYLLKQTSGSVNINWQKLINTSLGQRITKKVLNERANRQERSLTNLIDSIVNFLENVIAQLLAVPSCDKVGLRYSTNKTKLPDKIEWRQIGFAKELMNNLNKLVVIAGGSNSINDQEWEQFEPSFPYKKNINRNLLFKKTYFIRSPNTDNNCRNDTCIKITNYRDYTWIDMAKLICMTYIPSKKDSFNPPPGYIVSTTINKCQAVYFENELYQLSDGNGNFYAMHAFEKDGPTLDVVLPINWTLKKIDLSEPLIITPFGTDRECYYNILRDSIGQGYHQYIFANNYYP